MFTGLVEAMGEVLTFEQMHGGARLVMATSLGAEVRIGESLAEFVAGYLHQVVTSRSVVVILSDGLDRGDPSAIAPAMRAIRSRAGRIVWLNPLAGDARYEPTARAMQAALPFIDRLAPAHNLESLERLIPELAAV